MERRSQIINFLKEDIPFIKNLHAGKNEDSYFKSEAEGLHLCSLYTSFMNSLVWKSRTQDPTSSTHPTF